MALIWRRMRVGLCHLGGVGWESFSSSFLCMELFNWIRGRTSCQLGVTHCHTSAQHPEWQRRLDDDHLMLFPRCLTSFRNLLDSLKLFSVPWAQVSWVSTHKGPGVEPATFSLLGATAATAATALHWQRSDVAVKRNVCLLINCCVSDV